MTGPASLYGLARSAPRFKSSNAAATAACAWRLGLDGDPFVRCLRYEIGGLGATVISATVAAPGRPATACALC